MWARMMLSEKLNEAIVIVPFGDDDELAGPPVEPHAVVIRASATMLAPSTELRFNNILPPPQLTMNYASTAAESNDVPNASSFWMYSDVRSPAGVTRRCTPASENSTISESSPTRIAPA